MEPSLDLQKAIRARLVAASSLTSLVPAGNILDKNNRPEVFPCILIGESQTVPDDGLARNRHQVYTDLHLWMVEPGLTGSKQVAGAIRGALTDGPLVVTGYRVADLRISSTRIMRDPDGVHSHGVVSLECRVTEIS